MRATKALLNRESDLDLKLTEHRVRIAVADPPVVPRQTQREAVARETVLRLVNVSSALPRRQRSTAYRSRSNAARFSVLSGRSGAGKSTLIRCLNGLERSLTADALKSLGRRTSSSFNERELRRVRLRVGMIFQHFNLLSSKTVADNVALPLKIVGRTRDERREARCWRLLLLVGLEDKADAYPAQLSGGQKQRVGIARALARRSGDSYVRRSDLRARSGDHGLDSALLRDINRKLGLSIVPLSPMK